jgi:hypothetical protein
LIVSASHFWPSFTLKCACFDAKSTSTESGSTHGRDFNAVLTAPVQPIGQVMPSTVTTHSCEAEGFTAAVAGNVLAGVVVSFETLDPFPPALGAEESWHPARPTPIARSKGPVRSNQRMERSP